MCRAMFAETDGGACDTWPDWAFDAVWISWITLIDEVGKNDTGISYVRESPFWPIAIGFFGLGTGYFIWGGQALFGYLQSSPEVDRTMGLWGFWMPGFCQFLTGV